MKNRVLFLSLVFALAFVCLCGCNSKSNEFTVSYVYVYTDSFPSSDLLPILRRSPLKIVGQYQGSTWTATVDAKTFKDCTVVSAKPISDVIDIIIVPSKGSTGTGYDVKLMDGVLLQLKDAEGKTFDLTIKEGTILEGDTSESNTMRFTIPK